MKITIFLKIHYYKNGLYYYLKRGNIFWDTHVVLANYAL